jgi:predicted AlkP superfamily phosphohydrolase/phosphomutase
MGHPQLVIIGLDSATWDLMEPWIAQGQLPNLAKLVSDGVRGQLESAIPPLTPPAWTSFMTGKNPGKHGIFYFLEPQPGTYAMRYANAASRRSRTFFGLLSDAGIKVGTVNIPFTYPPEPLNGFQVSGMDTPSEKSAFIFPPELRQELESAVGKVLFDITHLGFMSTDDRREQVLGEMEKVDEQWAKIGLYLLEKHPAEVMMFTFMSIDTVQHHFWQYLDESHFLHDPVGARRFKDAILQVYRRLDTIV